MSNTMNFCEKCKGKGKVKIEGKRFKQKCDYCFGGGYFITSDNTQEFLDELMEKDGKHYSKIFGCNVICDLCCYAPNWKMFPRYYFSNYRWCWKKFQLVDRDGGCNKFRCICKHWKTGEDSEE